MKKILLTIAGYDPTSGAGAVMDMNVFRKLGFRGMGILTSLTIQNTQKVDRVFCPPASYLWQQYASLEEDMELAGIKVGMLGCRKNIKPVGRILSRNPHLPRVLDPILKSSSGIWLLEKEAVSEYMKTVAGRMNLITPNVQEAAVIAGMSIHTLKDMKEAAKKIFSLCRTPCLVTGGDLYKEKVDVLYDGSEFHVFRHKRLPEEVHGTGCFLSSAVLSFLCQGKNLKTACQKAAVLTHQMIGYSVKVGQGQSLFSFTR